MGNCCELVKKNSKAGGRRRRYDNVNPRKKRDFLSQSELQNSMMFGQDQMSHESCRRRASTAEISVLILGDVGVGKTKIANCLMRK